MPTASKWWQRNALKNRWMWYKFLQIRQMLCDPYVNNFSLAEKNTIQLCGSETLGVSDISHLNPAILESSTHVTVFEAFSYPLLPILALVSHCSQQKEYCSCMREQSEDRTKLDTLIYKMLAKHFFDRTGKKIGVRLECKRKWLTRLKKTTLWLLIGSTKCPSYQGLAVVANWNSDTRWLNFVHLLVHLSSCVLSIERIIGLPTEPLRDSS